MRIALVFASVVVLGGTLGAAALLAGSAPSFAAARSYPAGPDPVSVAIGDLNGDGKLDLATANTTAGTVSVLLNSGDGTLSAKVDYAAGFNPKSVAIGDLNGDGKADWSPRLARGSAASLRGTSSCSSTGATGVSPQGSNIRSASASD